MRNLIFLLSVALLLLTFSVKQSSADSSSWNKWVVPTPETKDQLMNDGDYNTFLNEWRFYLTYLCLVLFLPMLFGFQLCCCACCSCCVRCICAPKCIKAKNIPKEKVRLAGMIPYTATLCVIIVLTAFLIGFFIWGLVGASQLRQESFDQARNALTLPDRVYSSVVNFVDIVPKLVTRFSTLVDQLASISDPAGPIQTLYALLATVNDSIVALGPILDGNAQAYQDIKTAHGSMVDLLSGLNTTATQSITNMDFSTFDSVFANATSLISDTATSALDSMKSAIETAETQVIAATESLQSQISSFNSTVQSQIKALTDQIGTLTDQANTVVKDNVKESDIDQYEQYVLIFEIVFGIVCSVVIAFTAICLTCSCLWVVLVHNCCLKCLHCCGFGCIVTYGILGGIFLFIWCLTLDICRQFETYPVEIEDVFGFSIQVPSPPGLDNYTGATLKPTDTFYGILNCGDETFLKAGKLDFETFGVNDMINAYESKFRSAVDSFDVDGMVESTINGLTNFNNSIGISANMDEQLDQMRASLDEGILGYFASYPILINDISFWENEDEYFRQLNMITVLIAPFGHYYYGRSNITRLAPEQYIHPGTTESDIADPGITPGDFDITTDPEQTSSPVGYNRKGEDFDSVHGTITDIQKNLLWGTISGDTNYNLYSDSYVPNRGPEKFGLVYNLTQMNAPAPINSGGMKDAYDDMITAMNTLSEGIANSTAYVNTLFDFEDETQIILTSIRNTTENIISNIVTFVKASIDDLQSEVDETAILNCKFLGDFYRQVKVTYCGYINTSLGGTAIASIIMCFALFLIFQAVQWQEFLSHKSRMVEGSKSTKKGGRRGLCCCGRGGLDEAYDSD